jgi:hypothetical protein
VPIALFSVTADESFFVGDALRKLAEHLGGEGVPDEDWWVKVDGACPTATSMSVAPGARRARCSASR